ncbi:molybdenum cofactor guanylyltransferase MobA [Ciceribacter sp. RN22]|uniref:molybdenum cofactor guanylyltransferase MobA n=1 Tax=Ciceribacter sp. RN22 TaxID=2954932 RepID=UPI002092C92C|nr:molybdenum cofactor guanylyltransferase MobA [Ciceribacter sp. RN22]MCO6178620.1 molybdenum cofactor guanylyltransferase MobA [Ciceribacter sp. RN22]
MTRPPGIILAGGLSRRMGENKAAVRLGGKAMIRHVAERLAPQVSSLAVNAPEGADAGLGLPLVPDTIAGHPGPLAGVLAGLRHAQKLARPPRHIVTAPADTPFLPRDLVERLEAALPTADAIVVASSAGRGHPVVALWPLALADDLENWLANPENRRLQAFIARHPSASVDFAPIETRQGPLDPFFNVNTPDDLALAKALLEEEDG